MNEVYVSVEREANIRRKYVYIGQIEKGSDFEIGVCAAMQL